jgi:hypothetical protein
MDHEPEYWPGPAGMMRTTLLVTILLAVVWLSYLIFSPFLLAFATAAPIAAIGAAVLLVFVGIKTFKWVRRAM